MDAAYGRDPDDQDDVHDPAPPWQHGHCRRRRCGHERESNVQGSTDHGLLFHIWPGYLATPTSSMPTLKDYNEKKTPTTKEPNSLNWWKNYPKYSTSYLRSVYGKERHPRRGLYLYAQGR